MSDSIEQMAAAAEVSDAGLTREEIARRIENKGLGGGDMAKVLGVSRWGGPMDVWAQKLNLVPREPERPEQEFGKIMEPKMAQWYSSSRDVRLVRPGFMRHRLHSWLIGFIDRRVIGRGGVGKLVEIKTSRSRAGWSPHQPPGIPIDAYVQVQHYLLLAEDAPNADVVALLAGAWPPLVVEIERDAELQAMILERGAEFWTRHVMTGDPPPVDATAACGEYLAKRWPRDSGEVLSATLDDYNAAEELRFARMERDAAESRVLLAQNKLKARMAEATMLEGEGFTVTWKAAAQYDKTDWKALIAELAEEFGWQPDVLGKRIDKHTAKAGGGRRFVIRYDEEGE